MGQREGRERENRETEMNSEKKMINRCLMIYIILLCNLCYFLVFKVKINLMLRALK